MSITSCYFTLPTLKQSLHFLFSSKQIPLSTWSFSCDKTRNDLLQEPHRNLLAICPLSWAFNPGRLAHLIPHWPHENLVSIDTLWAFNLCWLSRVPFLKLSSHKSQEKFCSTISLDRRVIFLIRRWGVSAWNSLTWSSTARRRIFLNLHPVHWKLNRWKIYDG